jgi:hypothetical protein
MVMTGAFWLLSAGVKFEVRYSHCKLEAEKAHSTHPMFIYEERCIY